MNDRPDPTQIGTHDVLISRDAGSDGGPRHAHDHAGLTAAVPDDHAAAAAACRSPMPDAGPRARSTAAIGRT